MYFTITKKGEMKDLRIVSTSGYDSIDKKTYEFMSNLKIGWAPAEDEFGNKLDQELVLSYGMGGC